MINTKAHEAIKARYVIFKAILMDVMEQDKNFVRLHAYTVLKSPIPSCAKRDK